MTTDDFPPPSEHEPTYPTDDYLPPPEDKASDPTEMSQRAQDLLRRRWGVGTDSDSGTTEGVTDRLAPPRLPEKFRTPPTSLRRPIIDPSSVKPVVGPVKPHPVANWHTLSAHDRSKEWGRLRPFVEVLVVTYGVRTSEVPPCWWQHPDLVAELYALQQAHGFWFYYQDAGTGPLMWLEHFVSSRQRMSTIVSGTGCKKNAHVDPDLREFAGITTITDEQWVALASEPYTPPTQWPLTQPEQD